MPTPKPTPSRGKLECPSVQEWDFSKCPPDEVDYCRYYEYARHDEELKREVAERRAKDSWHSGISPEHWAYYEKRWLLTFFRIFKEFPGTPWLKILAAERKSRCRECRLLEGPFLTVSPERIAPEEPYPYVPVDVGIGTMHKVFVVEVDISASADALEQAFKRWLNANKPSSEVVKEKRGGVTDRDLLKALGAYRLLEYFGKSHDALTWTANHSFDGNPLYVGQSEWIKARKKARKFMNQGVSPSPAERVVARLGMAGLPRSEQAQISVHVMKTLTGPKQGGSRSCLLRLRWPNCERP